MNKRIFALLILVMGSAHAGWLDSAKSAMASKIQYHVRVLDEDGKPVAGASLWSTNVDEGDSSDWKVILTRVAQRHSDDYDYARPLGLMNSRMIVEYVDVGGELNWEWKTNKTPMLAFAALKRGYQPAAIEIRAKLNTPEELILRLKRNPQEIVDPRMETFDRLRAEVFNSRTTGVIADARVDFIESRQKQLRTLAADLESNSPDLAARVYMNLADMPSVDIFRRPDGSVAGRGFTNGYDEQNSQRREDFDHALALDQASAELQTTKVTTQENRSSIRLELKEKKIVLMRAGLQKVEAIKASAPDRIWPNTYLWLISRYIDIEEYANACQALKNAYAFEPAVMSWENWQRNRERINRYSTLAGLSVDCQLLAAAK